MIRSCVYNAYEYSENFTINIYPNPARHMQPFIIQVNGLNQEELKKSNLKIYNVTGHLVKCYGNINKLNTIVLPRGEYVVKVTSNKKTYVTSKIIVHK